ncbi:MAG: 23S rRNA (uracil(1939)-C(5))-methyltransferase RlmD [Vicinamibacterales bacterium]
MAPFCRHLGVCGGCAAPHLPYAAQLEAKARAIRTRLAAITGVDRARLAEPLFSRSQGLAGEPRHFRQKASFVFGSGPDRRLVMGHYARSSQAVVPVAECPVHSARANRLAFALRDHLAKAGLSAAGPGRLAILRHLLIRTSADDQDAIAMLVVTRNDKALRAPVRAWLASDDRPDGLFVNVHAAPGPYMVGRETHHVDGRSHVRERIGSLVFLVAPTAFFQTNVHAAAELQAAVLEAVGPARRVLDLYCGSGLLSLPLARQGAQVLGVEENRQAVADAERNRRFNHVAGSRARFEAGRVEDVLGSIRDRFDAVILDPPRQGCAPAVLEAVFHDLAPARAVYVSCNLEALALELPAMLRAGYEVAAVRAVDMFPHTDHIETVVTLVRTVAAPGQSARAPGADRGGRPRRTR